MPVQLQLKYIAQDGSELLKVITKLQQVTDNEELVEQSILIPFKINKKYSFT